MLDLLTPTIITAMANISLVLIPVLPFLLIRAVRSSKTVWWVLSLVGLSIVFVGYGNVVTFLGLIVFVYLLPWGQWPRWSYNLLVFITIFASSLIFGLGVKTYLHTHYLVNVTLNDISVFLSGEFIEAPFAHLKMFFTPLIGDNQPIVKFTILGLVSIILSIFTVTFIAHRFILTDHINARPVILATSFSILLVFLTAPAMLSPLFWVCVFLFPLLLIMILTIMYYYVERDVVDVINETESELPISIIMPCHNGADYIAKAIESVQAQSFTNWELMIIDDASTDTSKNIINHYIQNDQRIFVIHHDQAMGAGEARNAGLRASRGRYVAFLDCDDMWKPQKLELQLSAMQRTGAAISTTHYDVIDETDHVIGAVKPRDYAFTFGRLLKLNDIGCSVAMIDRALTGPNEFPVYERAQDFALWAQILAKGNLCLCIRKNLGAYRVHNKSRTLNKMNAAKNRIKIMNEYLHVPRLVLPYYVAFYAINGVLKQLCSGTKIFNTVPSKQ